VSTVVQRRYDRCRGQGRGLPDADIRHAWRQHSDDPQGRGARRLLHDRARTPRRPDAACPRRRPPSFRQKGTGRCPARADQGAAVRGRRTAHGPVLTPLLRAAHAKTMRPPRCAAAPSPTGPVTAGWPCVSGSSRVTKPRPGMPSQCWRGQRPGPAGGCRARIRILVVAAAGDELTWTSLRNAPGVRVSHGAANNSEVRVSDQWVHRAGPGRVHQRASAKPKAGEGARSRIGDILLRP